MLLVPRSGISHLPVSMDIEEKAIPRDADYTLMWIAGPWSVPITNPH